MDEDNEIEQDFEIEVATPEQAHAHLEALEDDELTAFRLASDIMVEYQPSFVIVGSPYMEVSDNGFTIPLEIGISINNSLNITKSSLATALHHVADQLSSDMDRLIDFVHNATEEEDDDSIG